jgi:DNA-binding transcriptional LysR family regulator
VDVELRHLRAFVTVAEELNFTRAARRLFIAQQALSTQIRQLEQRIGTQLLIRSSRSVTLTPAGHALFAQARLLIAGAEAAVHAALEAAGSRHTLTVGFVAGIDHAWAAAAINGFAASRPDVEVIIHFGDLLDPTGGVREGRADVAFTYGPFDTAGLELHPTHTEPMGVALAAHHPLATKPELTIADVVAEPTFDFPTPDTAWRTFWSAESYRGGRPARYVAQYRNLEGLVSALRAGLGVHLATRTLRDALGNDLVWRPLPDYPPLRRFVTHRAGEQRSTVTDFVQAVTTDLAQTASAGSADG